MLKTGIQFHFLQAAPSLRKRQPLKSFLKKMAEKEGYKIDHINYIFCSDDYLLEVNRNHLQHDYYTDIITFQLNETGAALLSDVYISIDRVKENAREFGSSIVHELHRVIFHGLLHLCGYKDKTWKDSQLMRSMEEDYLKRYFVSRGTGKKKL